MKDQRQMKIEELPQAESEELTPEEAEETQGGVGITLPLPQRPPQQSPPKQ
jgi:hypothetical protein